MALASATAIVTSSPALFSASDVMVGGAPSPTKLSYAKYELTSITDITWQGILDAYWGGYGDYIGSCCTTDALANLQTPPSVPAGRNYIVDNEDPNLGPVTIKNPTYGIDTTTGTYAGVGNNFDQPYPNDPYFPSINPAVQNQDGTWTYNQNGVYLTGIPGVLYYFTDQILDTLTPLTGPINLDNYYFEAGGLPALVYVAASQISPIAGQIVATIQNLPYVIAQTFVTATSLLPTFNIGPVKVGGGILSNAFFNGYSYLGTTYYGVPAITAYITDSIVTASLPTAATAAAKTATVAVAATATAPTAAETTTDKGVAETKSETPKAAPSSSSTEGSKGSTESGDSSTGGGSSSDNSSSSTPGSGSSSESGGSSTDGSGSDSTPATKPGTGTPKAGTQRAHTKPSDNPLSKIGKKISDAVSGKKSSDTSSSSTPGTGSGSSDSGSGSGSSGSGS